MAMNGRFITLEGIDGAGKSSHIEFISQRIRQRGFEVLSTREPGGTELGEKLRSLLLHEAMHAETEVLLMFASRREQLARIIEPALAAGTWVVCDRFTDSTYAYQCGGRGLPAERVTTIEQWVHGHLQPNLTLLFDAPLEVARERLDRNTPDPDKFERERGEFFARVRANYLDRARADQGRIKVINSARDLAVIQAEVAALIDAL